MSTCDRPIQPHGPHNLTLSGLTGEEMPCDIFIGLVYYQRLRHMVSDKFQVCEAYLDSAKEFHIAGKIFHLICQS